MSSAATLLAFSSGLTSLGPVPMPPLLNHQSKLAVERHLLGSLPPFTILQPMHYMQAVDVPACLDGGVSRQPFSLERPLSFVDLADVGAAGRHRAVRPREAPVGHLRAVRQRTS